MINQNDNNGNKEGFCAVEHADSNYAEENNTRTGPKTFLFIIVESESALRIGGAQVLS